MHSHIICNTQVTHLLVVTICTMKLLKLMHMQDLTDAILFLACLCFTCLYRLCDNHCFPSTIQADTNVSYLLLAVPHISQNNQ